MSAHTRRKKISTIYHAVNVNIYLECHLPHKYGCENVIGHGEEKPLLPREKEEGEKKRESRIVEKVERGKLEFCQCCENICLWTTWKSSITKTG